MDLKYLIPACLCVVLIISCGKKPSYYVHTIGEIEVMMKRDDLTTHFEWKEWKEKPHLYGLGNITNLQGAVVVLNNKQYTGYVRNDSIQIDSTSDFSATLMLCSQVEEWKEMEIPADVITFDMLTDFVKHSAEVNGINSKHAFPFLLKGIPASIHYMVLNWDTAIKNVSSKAIYETAKKGTLSGEGIVASGFYSSHNYEVLAEKNMHIHFVNESHTISAHADEINAAGMKLFLPVNSYRPVSDTL